MKKKICFENNKTIHANLKYCSYIDMLDRSILRLDLFSFKFFSALKITVKIENMDAIMNFYL